jgi:hypothetical protein
LVSKNDEFIIYMMQIHQKLWDAAPNPMMSCDIENISWLQDPTSGAHPIPNPHYAISVLLIFALCGGVKNPLSFFHVLNASYSLTISSSLVHHTQAI